MNAFKLLLAGAAVGIILTAFRDEDGEGWIVPGRDLLRELGADGNGNGADREPILGYDGMDDDAVQDWLEGSDADRSTLLRMLTYEAAHRGRQPVLAAIVDQL